MVSRVVAVGVDTAYQLWYSVGMSKHAMTGGFKEMPRAKPIAEALSATIRKGNSTKEQDRMCDAAPDLLHAAKRALSVLRAQGEAILPGNVLGALDAAITKATGK